MRCLLKCKINKGMFSNEVCILLKDTSGQNFAEFVSKEHVGESSESIWVEAFEADQYYWVKIPDEYQSWIAVDRDLIISQETNKGDYLMNIDKVEQKQSLIEILDSFAKQEEALESAMIALLHKHGWIYECSEREQKASRTITKSGDKVILQVISTPMQGIPGLRKLCARTKVI